MAQPRTVGEALDQARSQRDAGDRHEIALEQIADALIEIRWSLIGIASTLASKMR
jgi:hypothetical protein